MVDSTTLLDQQSFHDMKSMSDCYNSDDISEKPIIIENKKFNQVETFSIKTNNDYQQKALKKVLPKFDVVA